MSSLEEIKPEMLEAYMKVAQKDLRSAQDRFNRAERDLAEAKQKIAELQKHCQHPAEKRKTLPGQDAVKCGICGKNMSD